MRYWAYFAAKLVVASVTLYGLLALLNWGLDPKRGSLDQAAFRSIKPRAGFPVRLNHLQSSPANRNGRPVSIMPQVRGAAPNPPVVIIETEEQAAQERAQLAKETERRFGPQIADGVYLPPRFGYELGYTLAVLAWFLLCTGALYAIIWDQRYRCRVCLRRLRMPIETGSWSRMLQFGRPRIEYICPYGHGTLREDELQISGLENPEWTPHSDDLWEELCASSKEPGDQP